MSAEYTPCKVCLVEGYLGAGKTTLLNKVLAQPNGHRIAVIVNDIGEINIDARLIEKSGGGVTMQDGDLIPLTNGCICCTLSEDLAQQLSDLACSNKYDYIVIEASGICEPMPIAQTITMMSEATKRQGMPEIVHVDNIVAVVDAARLKDEFSCGEVLREVPEDEEDLASLLIQQIEFCDTIMLNKCDLVTEEELQQIEAVLRALQTRAKIIRCEYGDVPMEEVLDTDRFNYEEVAMSAGWIQAIENDDEDHDEHHDEHEHHHHEDALPEEYLFETALLQFVNYIDCTVRGIPCDPPTKKLMKAAHIAEIDEAGYINSQRTLIDKLRAANAGSIRKNMMNELLAAEQAALNLTHISNNGDTQQEETNTAAPEEINPAPATTNISDQDEDEELFPDIDPDTYQPEDVPASTAKREEELLHKFGLK